MRAKLVVNPVAGADAAPDYLPLINERLRRFVGSLDIVMTIAEGDATRAAADAVRDGCELLFVAGGDGTLNEVLNGVAGLEGGLQRVTFGVIPLGTGNDFATALGFAGEVPDILDALDQRIVVEVDVGVLNGRCFVNVSGGGFIAEVSDAVNPQLKTIAGKLAYLIGGAQVLLNHEPVRARAVIRETPGAADAAPRDLTLHAFAVCNSRLIGGGRLIAPDAVMDDGRLDVCLIEAMPTVEFLALLSRVSDGDHVSDERVRYFRAVEVELAFERVVKVNTDGQVLDARTCHYRVLPRAARFLAATPTPAAS